MRVSVKNRIPPKDGDDSNSTAATTFTYQSNFLLNAARPRCMTVRTLKESLQKEKTIQQLQGRDYRRKMRLSKYRNYESSSAESPIGESPDENLTTATYDSTVDSEVIEPMSVSFSTVEIRQYPIILGDNPAVTNGPPYSIDWNHVGEERLELETYESMRPTQRTLNEMIIPLEARTDRLKKLGFNKQEIARTSKEMDKIRVGRFETRTMFYRHKTEEKMERVKKGVKNIVTGRKKKQQEFIETSLRLASLQMIEANLQARSDEELIEKTNLNDDSFSNLVIEAPL